MKKIIPVVFILALAGCASFSNDPGVILQQITQQYHDGLLTCMEWTGRPSLENEAHYRECNNRQEDAYEKLKEAALNPPFKRSN